MIIGINNNYSLYWNIFMPLSLLGCARSHGSPFRHSIFLVSYMKLNLCYVSTKGRIFLKDFRLRRLLCITLPRGIQREDCKNRKKRLAPLPTAQDKASTGSYGVSFCSLSQYNLRHRGDFLISLTFLRNSTPNIGGGHPLKKPKNPIFGVKSLEQKRNSKFASVA